MPYSWGSCGKSCETRQKHIATVACGIELRGAQGAPHAALAPVRGVHREMAPPRAVVVPQVVVGIVGAGAQGQLDGGRVGRLAHEVLGLKCESCAPRTAQNRLTPPSAPLGLLQNSPWRFISFRPVKVCTSDRDRNPFPGTFAVSSARLPGRCCQRAVLDANKVIMPSHGQRTRTLCVINSCTVYD